MTIMDDNVLYHLNGVQQTYNGRIVLDIEQLSIRRGEILGLVGPSGAGKSTLLRLLGFLETPAAGEVSYDGRTCTQMWPDLETRRQVTMVFQKPHLLRRSVSDNVTFAMDLRGWKNGSRDVAPMLRRLGLEELAPVKANTLSGGEAQRVALARALVLKPDVLLLDEPTANLDPYNIKLIEDIVKRSNEEDGTTVVMVTHNIFQARRLAHRVGLLLSSKLIEVSEAEAFFTSPRRSETEVFVRGDMVY